MLHQASGIAALLLDGGRTAHSRFALPINVFEDSMCSFSIVSKHLKDICRNDDGNVFGGKVVLFGGDFRSFIPIGCNSVHNAEIKDFDNWILDIGDGKLGGRNDGEAVVEFHAYLRF
ncbi:ATP-dependent DNA helicase PIF1-like protein [Tanacetum coccineum]|uniref:ATP-dependent DNA helicase n=1 Tax=Tanacetum coccineum TaxID=301880 RepID=A0ABQ5GSB3_9ASTR